MCCHIHGFQPYFFAAMPPSFAPDDVEAFRKALNVRARVLTRWRVCVCVACAHRLLWCLAALMCHHACHSVRSRACLGCAQDRTGEATSGRQQQAVYVTRVEVVNKQTLELPGATR